MTDDNEPTTQFTIGRFLAAVGVVAALLVTITVLAPILGSSA